MARLGLVQATDVITTDGSVQTVFQLTIPEGGMSLVDVQFCAYDDSNGASVHQWITAGVKRKVGQAAERVGGVVTLIEKRDGATTGANGDISVSGNDVIITVKGILARTFRWMVWVEASEFI